ncbi:unnamed protein product, partial [Boreogadus saida]
MVIFSTLVYHCGTPRYMEPHILGWRPLMLRLIYFLFLRPSLMTSMCSLSSLWPPLSSLSSLWPPAQLPQLPVAPAANQEMVVSRSPAELPHA